MYYIFGGRWNLVHEEKIYSRVGGEVYYSREKNIVDRLLATNSYILCTAVRRSIGSRVLTWSSSYNPVSRVLCPHRWQRTRWADDTRESHSVCHWKYVFCERCGSDVGANVETHKEHDHHAFRPRVSRDNIATTTTTRVIYYTCVCESPFLYT